MSSKNPTGSSIVSRLRNVHPGFKVSLLHVTGSAPFAVPCRHSSVPIVDVWSTPVWISPFQNSYPRVCIPKSSLGLMLIHYSSCLNAHCQDEYNQSCKQRATHGYAKYTQSASTPSLSAPEPQGIYWQGSFFALPWWDVSIRRRRRCIIWGRASRCLLILW